MRRHLSELPLTLVLLVAFFAAAYSPVVVDREALFPADVLVLHTGFRHAAAEPGEPTAGILTDPIYQIYPWRFLAREQLRDGTVPLWNPHSGLGVPLLANFQSAPFDPTALPFVLAKDPARGWTWTSLLRMLIAGCGLYLLARAVGARRLGARVAALGYAFAGTTGTMIHWPNSAVAAWFPLELLAVEALIRRPTWGRTVALAVTMFLSILGGHPEVLLVTQGAAFLWVLLRRPMHRARARCGTHVATIGRFVVASALALAWGAPVILPGVEYVLETARIGHMGSPAAVAGSSYPWSTLAALVAPDLFGGVGDFAGPRNAVWMHAAFVGAFGIVLGFCGLGRRRIRSITAFALLATALAVSLAWTSPLNAFAGTLPLLGVCPLYHFSVAANLGVALLAALGITGLRAASRSRWVLLSAGAAVAVAFVVVGRIEHRDAVVTAELVPMLERTVPLVGLVAIAALVAIRPRARWTVALLLAAAVAELWFVQAPFRGTVPRDWVYPRAAWADRARAPDGSPPTRLATVSEDGGPVYSGLLPNLAAVYGLGQVGTCDPMAPAELAWLVRRIGNTTPSPIYLRPDASRASVLDFLGVRALAIPDAWPGFDRMPALAGDALRATPLVQRPPVPGPADMARLAAGRFVELPIDAAGGRLRGRVAAEGAPVRLRVSTARVPRDERVFACFLDPRRRPEDRGWRPIRCDLSRYAGRRVRIHVRTTPGPARDNACDAVVIADVEIAHEPGASALAAEARFGERVPGQIDRADVALDGVSRPSLVMHAPSSMAFTFDVPVSGAHLTANVGVALPAAGAIGDGALLELRVSDVPAWGAETTLDVGTQPVDVDVPLPAGDDGGRAWVRFSCDAGPPGSKAVLRFDALRLDPRTGPPAAAEGGLGLFERAATTPHAFVAHGARIDADPVETRALLDFGDADRAPFIEGLDTAVDPAGRAPTPVTITDYRADRITLDVSTEHAGWLVVRDGFYPGWKARINTRPADVVRANRVFRAVRVPPGRHTVVLRYDPDSWRFGCALAVAATLALGLGAWLRRRRAVRSD